MATYCVNHVEEEVERLSKLGKVKKTPTKEGMCGHLGGCNTDNLGLVELQCDYGKKRKAPKVKEPEVEISTDSGSGTDAIVVDTGEGTTATEVTSTASEEEKPVEA